MAKSTGEHKFVGSLLPPTVLSLAEVPMGRRGRPDRRRAYRMPSTPGADNYGRGFEGIVKKRRRPLDPGSVGNVRAITGFLPTAGARPSLT